MVIFGGHYSAYYCLYFIFIFKTVLCVQEEQGQTHRCQIICLWKMGILGPFFFLISSGFSTKSTYCSCDKNHVKVGWHASAPRGLFLPPPLSLLHPHPPQPAGVSARNPAPRSSSCIRVGESCTLSSLDNLSTCTCSAGAHGVGRGWVSVPWGPKPAKPLVSPGPLAQRWWP